MLMKHIHTIIEDEIEIHDVEPVGFQNDGNGYKIYGVANCSHCNDDNVEIDGWSEEEEPDKDDIKWERNGSYQIIRV